MGFASIGGYPQPITTPLTSGPAAMQQTKSVEAGKETSTGGEQRNPAQSFSNGTTPTRGQNLNITA